MVGRKPKATPLHLVENTLNSTRHKNRAIEPKPKGTPVKPAALTGAASDIWDEYVVIGYWLTAADSKTLAAWCWMTVELETTMAAMRADRMAQWRALSSMLGFDPSARSRIHSSVPEEPKDNDKKYYA